MYRSVSRNISRDRFSLYFAKQSSWMNYKSTATVVVAFVSHIQRTGCQPEKLLYTVANPARGLLNREKRTKGKVWQHTSPTPSPPTYPHTARSEKNNKNHVTHLHALRRSRSISRLYKDSLDSSTRPKDVAWQNSTLLCAVISRVYLLFPPRGYEPPTNLRDRLNPHLSLKRRRFPMPRYAKRPDVALYAIGPLFLFPTPSSSHRTLKVPNTIRFGSRPPLFRMSVPAHKSLLVRNVVSMLSTRLSQWHGCTRSSDGPVSCAVPRQ